VILILEVAAPQPTSLGRSCRQTFRGNGGTIGRDQDNSWVLPHPKVSGHHAVISHENEVFYIEDLSRNGVCLNSSKNRLERGRPYALTSGDRILIDPYEIRVSITRDQNDATERGELSDIQSSDLPSYASDPFGNGDPFGPLPIASSGIESPGEESASRPLDPLELLNLVPKRVPPRKVPSARDLERGLPLDGHYQPPAVMPAPASALPASVGAIPHGYDPLAQDDAPFIQLPASSELGRDERAADRPNQAEATPLAISPAHRSPAVRPIPPAQMPPPAEKALGRESVPDLASGDPACAADFAAVLAGAGLDPGNVTPEVAHDFGQILRVVVSGVMDVMRSRQEIKDEFRMRTTRFRSTENNPLKFSANVDDALHNLLVKRNRAYLPAVEAFEDAFADLRHHQIAMLAGMRVAFESMLAEFDPDRLQQEFDRHLNKGLVPAKLRYWDLFREKCQEIAKDREASFRRLFGDEFARAYEEQLKQLKAQERSAAGASSSTPSQPDR
jgi:type VI secretion system FHA domain protein